MNIEQMIRQMSAALSALLAALILISIPLGAVEPTPAKPFYDPFTDDQEMALGRQAAAETDKQMPILDQSVLTAYLNNLGRKVAQASRRPQIKYTFRIVNTDVVNAFSLPGGFIYVHRGLLDFVQSESELAGVLAHEVGHVVAYHSLNNVARQYWLDQGMTQLKQAGVLKDEQFVDILQKYGGPILLFADRKFSREEESEADMLGVYNASRAGYDPEGLVLALNRLSSFDGNPSLIETFLLDHPLSADRVQALRTELGQNPAPAGLKQDSYAFKAAKLLLSTLPPPPKPKAQPQQ